MSLSYKKLSRAPQVFLRACGITKGHFDEVLLKLEPLWEEDLQKRYKKKGRDFSLSLADIFLMLLVYYRTYTSQVWIGFLFDLDDSNVSRLIRRVEPLLAQLMTINKERMMSQEDLQQCIIDASEQKIHRPSTEDQRPYYSGKKKQHTLKTEIQTNLKGKIVHVSDSVPGSTHDFELHKQQPPAPENERDYVDSGYQGLQKIHAATELPFKASKNKPLDEESKQYNTALSRIRVKIENIWGDIKVFGIIKNVYRNPRETYNRKLVIITGLVNMKNGFGLPA